MTRIGAIFRPQHPPEELIEVARTAESAGLDELWLWEDCFATSGLAAAVAALGATSSIRVGIGLLPVPLRNPAITAMELATVERLFPGRLLPAFGHGVQEWMTQVGAKVASPLTLMREYVEAQRALLGGHTLDVEGRYVTLRDVTLAWPPRMPPPLYVGAVGPKTLQLAGGVADGTVLTAGTSPDMLRAARAEVETGGAAPEHQLVVYVAVGFGDGAAERMAVEAARWGWAPDEDNVVAGTPAEVAAGLQRWIDAGADAVILQESDPEPDLLEFYRSAGEVKAILDAG